MVYRLTMLSRVLRKPPRWFGFEVKNLPGLFSQPGDKQFVCRIGGGWRDTTIQVGVAYEDLANSLQCPDSIKGKFGGVYPSGDSVCF